MPATPSGRASNPSCHRAHGGHERGEQHERAGGEQTAGPVAPEAERYASQRGAVFQLSGSPTSRRPRPRLQSHDEATARQRCQGPPAPGRSEGPTQDVERALRPASANTTQPASPLQRRPSLSIGGGGEVWLEPATGNAGISNGARSAALRPA